jgi:20S proteasome alpha/beta subunit
VCIIFLVICLVLNNEFFSFCLICFCCRYQRRNKMDPLYNQLVVAGFRDGKAFLGSADMQGTNFEDNHISTGYLKEKSKQVLMF